MTANQLVSFFTLYGHLCQRICFEWALLFCTGTCLWKICVAPRQTKWNQTLATGHHILQKQGSQNWQNNIENGYSHSILFVLLFVAQGLASIRTLKSQVCASWQYILWADAHMICQISDDSYLIFILEILPRT